MDQETPAGDRVFAYLSNYFALLCVVALLVWFICAVVAFIVAPEDRPWSFFWCTLLFLGPLGIVLALIAPSRPKDNN